MNELWNAGFDAVIIKFSQEDRESCKPQVSSYKLNSL